MALSVPPSRCWRDVSSSSSLVAAVVSPWLRIVTSQSKRASTESRQDEKRVLLLRWEIMEVLMLSLMERNEGIVVVNSVGGARGVQCTCECPLDVQFVYPLKQIKIIKGRK
jgi:hypothetical protein